MQTYSTVLNLCPRKATTVPHKVSAVDYLLAWAIWKNEEGDEWGVPSQIGTHDMMAVRYKI